MRVEKIFPKAIAVAVLVQVFIWAPLATLVLIPALVPMIHSDSAHLFSVGVMFVPMIILITFIAYVLLTED